MYFNERVPIDYFLNTNKKSYLLIDVFFIYITFDTLQALSEPSNYELRPIV